jgi:ribosomal protein S6--L-glutamate ligase
MLIYVLSRSINLYSTTKIIDAIKTAQHRVKVIDYMYCDLLFENGQYVIMYEGQELPKPDYIIPRIAVNVTSYGEKVIRHFEKQGVKTLTSADGLINARDKIKSYQILAEHQIKTPITYFSNDFHQIETIVDYKLGYPFILKLNEGTQGKGVYLIKNKGTATKYFDHFAHSTTMVLLQEFIKESAGRDLRVFVVGNKVVASMERVALKNEFRSNIHCGAKGHLIQLTPSEIEMSIKAVQLLNLKIGGVDLIRSKKGTLLLEVNTSPGLEGIEDTTKINVAEEIIKFIENDFKNF